MIYNDRLDCAYRTLVAKRTDYDKAKENKELYEQKQEEHTTELKDIESAVTVVQSVATGLQNQVLAKIQAIVQSALDATFPSCRFAMEFVSRRDKTEVDMFITDAEGNKQSILDGSGGGLADMVSFALRVAVWSLDRGASSVILLDEPIKFLSKGMRDAGAKLFKVLSKELGIQFIIVSHIEEVIDNADKVYSMAKGDDGVTRLVV